MNLKRREAGPEGLRILMSIRPEWTEKIFAGSKLIEVRLTAPHIESERQFPIRVYVYETKGTKAKPGAGAVIGEFTCPWICRTNVERLRRDPLHYDLFLKDCVMSKDEFETYVGERDFAAWDIVSRRHYAEPEPLAAFNLKRAPQSWMKLRPWGVRK